MMILRCGDFMICSLCSVDVLKSLQAVEEAVPNVPSNDAPQGVLPRLIATLVGRRRQVKSLMKDKSAGAVKLLQVSRSYFEEVNRAAKRIHQCVDSGISSKKLSNSLLTQCMVVWVSPVRAFMPALSLP
jgi:hypothetical protein